jgi:hypothetical protein
VEHTVTAWQIHELKQAMYGITFQKIRNCGCLRRQEINQANETAEFYAWQEQLRRTQSRGPMTLNERLLSVVSIILSFQGYESHYGQSGPAVPLDMVKSPPASLSEASPS